MMRLAMAGLSLLALAGCKDQDAKTKAAEGAGQPVATSIDDFSLPVDRSAQVTAIDAATGDARGMPADGGGVVTPPKPEPQPTVAANETAPTTAPPQIVPPPPPAAPDPAQGE